MDLYCTIPLDDLKDNKLLVYVVELELIQIMAIHNEVVDQIIVLDKVIKEEILVTELVEIHSPKLVVKHILALVIDRIQAKVINHIQEQVINIQG
jgi:hypothetical protein